MSIHPDDLFGPPIKILNSSSDEDTPAEDAIRSHENLYNPNLIPVPMPVVPDDNVNEQASELILNMSQVEKDSYMDDYRFPGCRDAARYRCLEKIGEGTYGEVCKAVDESERPPKFVAMKKILMQKKESGFPVSALREIKLLRHLEHPNIVNLIEVCLSKAGDFYMIFDFCEHDLSGLLANPLVRFSLGEIKNLMQQLFSGLEHLHANRIMHRDLKTANLLVTKQGKMKIADFGLAKDFGRSEDYALRRKKNQRPFTRVVVTLWYRPPEILLGYRYYGTSCDIWSAGLIMAEMWTRTAVLKGNAEQQQLRLIQRLCGSIMESADWPSAKKMPLYGTIELEKGLKRQVRERLEPWVKDGPALDLIDKLLQLDPKRRLKAEEALEHEFFKADPKPQDVAETLSKYPEGMFEYKASGRRVPPKGVPAFTF